MRPSFFQPEGVLTEVRERIVEINPSEHPGAASLQTLNMQWECLQTTAEILFKHLSFWPNRRHTGRVYEERHPTPKGSKYTCYNSDHSDRW